MVLPELEIRAALSRYLAGSISLDEFEEWFVAETWHIEHAGGERAIRLAAHVRSELFALTTGETSEDDFRALARAEVSEVLWDQEPTGPRLASDSEVIRQPA